MNIKEFSSLVGLSAHTLRYYEKTRAPVLPCSDLLTNGLGSSTMGKAQHNISNWLQYNRASINNPI